MANALVLDCEGDRLGYKRFFVLVFCNGGRQRRDWVSISSGETSVTLLTYRVKTIARDDFLRLAVRWGGGGRGVGGEGNRKGEGEEEGEGRGDGDGEERQVRGEGNVPICSPCGWSFLRFGSCRVLSVVRMLGNLTRVLELNLNRPVVADAFRLKRSRKCEVRAYQKSGADVRAKVAGCLVAEVIRPRPQYRVSYQRAGVGQ